MQDRGPLQTIVPRPGGPEQILSLTRPASRVAPPSIRATAIVFQDPVSLAIRSELDRLAPSDASLVIVGETGTGKELVARYIHQNSARHTGPFLAVNCGALVDTLVEAELFGFEKGAFTGALKTQVGWFEAANGGTLLLDEIGDLPPSLQVKLLRVLQEREVVRLGARVPVAVDVRVIAATNVDLESAVAAGQFRQDLYFRLNVATVKLPPLRDRPGDIEHLSAHFLSLYSEKMGRSGLTLGPGARTALIGYSWPGNIRELENVVHNAVLLATGPVIEASELKLSHPPTLPDGIATFEDEVRALVDKHLAQQEPDLLERMTSVAVQRAYERSNSNQVRAAERLGLTRNAMRTHLAHLGIIAGRASRRQSDRG